MASVRRMEEEEEQESLSINQIVKNTWRKTMGGWGFGKKEDGEGLTKSQRRRLEKKKKRKKNPVIEMMINMATKSAAKFVSNKLGISTSTISREKDRKEKRKNLWTSLWGFGPDKDDKKEDAGDDKDDEKEDTGDDKEGKGDVAEPAIMTLDLDKLL